MEEIKIGEYIRTVAGYIGKIINFSDGMYTAQMKDATIDLYIDDIKNHKENIIDLIECGDYVNGTEVVTVYGYDEDGNDKDELGIIEVVGEEAWGIYLTGIKKIKNIVTKEQFDSRKYIVGDE